MDCFDPTTASPAQIRRCIRHGQFTGSTAALAPGYVQANLVVVPAAYAKDFEAFCGANPQPCPLLEALPPGVPSPTLLAQDADLRFDLPRYRIYEASGAFQESPDLAAHWHDDGVAFLLGCSFSFEHALARAGLVPRHVERGRNVPMYQTNRKTTPAGAFAAPLVVSMRPFAPQQVELAHRITAALPHAHGAPVHIGDAKALGIKNLDKPDFGDAVDVRDAEVTVFWACGVTSHLAVMHALSVGMPWAITHAPGHMFISDRTT